MPMVSTDLSRKLNSIRPPSNDEKVAIDHILEAQKNGEINEDNVLYIIENINVAGRAPNKISIHMLNSLRDEIYMYIARYRHPVLT